MAAGRGRPLLPLSLFGSGGSSSGSSKSSSRSSSSSSSSSSNSSSFLFPWIVREVRDGYLSPWARER